MSRFQKFSAETIHRKKISGVSWNPRTITPAQRRKLKRSIEKFGLSETLIWNRRTGNLVGGHQRLSLLDELEGTDDYSLTVSVVDLDDATERALNVALNNPEAQGAYDLDLLANVVGGLLDTSPALVQDAGLDRSSLAMLFGDSFLEPAAAQQAAQDAPVVAELNEMYEAGRAAEKARRAAQAQAANLASRDAPPGSADPAPNPAPAPDQPPAAGPAAGQWTNQDFANRRREFKGDSNLLDQADVYLSLTFDSAQQLAAFRDYAGLDPLSRAVDAVHLLGLLELDLRGLEASYAAQPAGEPDESVEPE